MNEENTRGQLFPTRFSLGQSLLWIASVVLIYFAVARLSSLLMFQPEGIAAIWPPSGIFLSAILLTRRELRLWLAGLLFLTDFVAEMLAGIPFLVSAMYSLALTGDAVLSCWLLFRFVGEPLTFTRVRDVTGWLVLSVLLSNSLMALVAAAASQLLPGTHSFSSSWQWWAASDGVGNLLLTPLFLTWAVLARTRLRTWNRQKVLEGAALFILVPLLNVLFLSRLSEHVFFTLLLPFVTFPFLMWAALRFGMRGVATALFIVAAILIPFAASGHVPSFSYAPGLLDEVIIAQLFLVSLAVPSFILASVVDERKQAEKALREEKSFTEKLFNAPLDTVFLFDPASGRPLRWNKRFSEVSGYTDEEIGRMKAPDDFYDEDDLTKGHEAIAKMFAEGGGVVELSLVTKLGTRIPFEYVVTPVEAVDGKTLFLSMGRDLTGHKQAEEALRESERKFRETVANLDEGYYSVTLDGVLLEHNQAFSRILGFDEAADLKGRLLPDFWQNPDQRKDYLQRLTTQGSISNYEINARKKNGEGIAVLASAHFAKAKIGSPLRIEGVFLDITKHKRTEEALRNSEMKLRAVLDATPFPVAMVDTRDDVIEFWSRSALSLFGHTAPTAATWYQTAYPDPDYRREVVDRWKPFLERAKQSDRPVNTGEYRVACRDGSVRICELYATFLPNNLIVTFNDITGRKQAEEALRKSEEEFRTLAEAMPQIVWVTRPDGWNIYFNQQWMDYTGLTLEESYGHGWNTPFHPNDRQRAWDAWQRATQNNDTYSLECRLRRADGAYRWWLIRGEPLRDAKGEILKWFGTCTDIESMKLAEEEIRRLNAELEQRVIDRTAQLQAANKELEAFSYSVSHDLRAPLRAIDGFSRVLLEEYTKNLDAEGRRLLAVVRENTARMAQLIDDLLALSRFGRSPMNRERVNMTKLANEAFEELVPLAERTRGELTISDLPNAYGDEALIKQVWTNLISNAWKFSRTRERRVVNIGGRTENGECVYFVKDNGAGFDETYKHKLFGVFQRLHTTAEFEGTGVGLAIVQRIVGRHGGRVWAEGKVGEGATFYFTLPIT